jgi:hypothetical protein
MANDPDFDGSTLWSVSDFDQWRSSAAASAHGGAQRTTIISTTLQAELRLLDRRRESADVLEVVAACVRLREPALVYMQGGGVVWPVTLFPAEMLYHSPRSLLQGTRSVLGSLVTLEVEPPGVRPPGHWMHERVANADAYRPLLPALWHLALHGPRNSLLNEIGGTAAYRALRDPARLELPTPGALAPAVTELLAKSTSLRRIASGAGMSSERASRLLNGLYLTSNLIVSRTHHAARSGPLHWLFGRHGK